jgi:hypothetical protein
MGRAHPIFAKPSLYSTPGPAVVQKSRFFHTAAWGELFLSGFARVVI